MKSRDRWEYLESKITEEVENGIIRNERDLLNYLIGYLSGSDELNGLQLGALLNIVNKRRK